MPELPRGKGNKMFGLSAKKVAAARSTWRRSRWSRPTQSCDRAAASARMTLKFGELKDYRGERGQRGAVLPRGWRKVERLETSSRP